MGAPTDVVVRLATAVDADAVREIGLRTWPPTYAPIVGEDFVRCGLDRWWSAGIVLESIQAGRTIVGEHEGTLLGMASVGPSEHTLMLWKLYVLPEGQGRGVGRALVEEVLARASREGFENVRLSYLDGNDHAAGFYASQGFAEVGRDSEGQPPFDVWMEKDVAPWGHNHREPDSSVGQHNPRQEQSR